MSRRRFACAVLLLAGCAREAAPKEESAPVAKSPHAANVVHLDAEAQARLGITVAELAPRSTTALARAYGRVVADPSRTFEVRAPVAGIVHARDAWPGMGETPASLDLGWIEPRFAPLERTDLEVRAAEANRASREAIAALEVSKHELSRARSLNAEGKGVSDRALEEAEARATSDAARVESTKQELEVLDGMVHGGRPLPQYALKLASAAQVIEIAARPGEDVQAGALILRAALFDPALLRVELPIGDAIEHPGRARIVAASSGGRAFDATFVTGAPSSETQGRALLFRAASETGLRPGEAVTAWIEDGIHPLEGLVVPRSAVVRHAEKAWIYARKDEETFVRLELRLQHPLPDGWLAVEPAIRELPSIVVEGAQSLLSTEILAAAGGGGEEE